MCALKQFEFIASTDLPNLTYLQFYETYGCISLTYVLDGTTHEYELKEEDFDEDSFPLDDITWIKNNLSKMTCLEKFEYISEFDSEINFSFLVNKPETLTELSISHIEGLDMEFLRGVKKLTLNAVFIEEEEMFLDLVKRLPSTLEVVEVTDIDDCMKELVKNTEMPYRLETF